MNRIVKLLLLAAIFGSCVMESLSTLAQVMTQINDRHSMIAGL